MLIKKRIWKRKKFQPQYRKTQMVWKNALQCLELNQWVCWEYVESKVWVCHVD